MAIMRGFVLRNASRAKSPALWILTANCCSVLSAVEYNATVSYCKVDGASTRWSLVIGLPVVVMVVIIGLGVAYWSRRTRRLHAFLRQGSQTSRATVCTQLSVTGNSTAVNSGTLRSTRRTALTAVGAMTDSSDCTYVIAYHS